MKEHAHALIKTEGQNRISTGLEEITGKIEKMECKEQAKEISDMI